MNIQLQVAMIVLALCLLVFVIKQCKKMKMNVRLANIWIIGAICVLILSFFPQILDKTAQILNISSPITALFFIAFLVIYLLVFYVYTKLSYLDKRINNLTYENALLRKQMESYNEKK